MYTIDNDTVVQAIESDGRTFRAKLVLADGTVISGSDVGEITLEHTASDADTVTVGDIISKHAEITLLGRYKLPRGMPFWLYLYLLDAESGVREGGATVYEDLEVWTGAELAALTYTQTMALSGNTKDTDGQPLEDYFIPFGELIAVKCTEKDNVQTIIAYDRLAFADKTYVPAISFPASSFDVLDDILTQLGIAGRVTLDAGELICDGETVLDADGESIIMASEYAFTISEAPEERTMREVLRDIITLYGKNGILNRDGLFETAFLTQGGTLDPDRLDEPEMAQEDVQLAGLSCDTDGDILTAGTTGSAYTMEMESTYMTQARLDTLWQTLRQYRWRPFEACERLGDPRRDFGDSTTYGSYTFPLASLVYHFDGGLYTDLSAYGDVETDEIYEFMDAGLYEKYGAQLCDSTGAFLCVKEEDT